MSGLLEAVDEAAALELLHDLGCTDGLPVVVPTPERVARMVLASGLDGDLVLGELGPAMGAATVEGAATAAVMAGCLPDHAPLVVAAVRALADPRFDLGELQATTHGGAPLLIVNGPARGLCGLASGYGALGPGHRANASIGRAVRLALINIGGGRPGISDMALLGHPGKFAYCLAEAEEASPWEPLHVSLGFAPEESVVTILAADAPTSAIAVSDADDPASPDRIIDALAAAFSAIATNNAALRGGAAAVIVNPDHAAVLARAGYARADVQAALAARCGNRRAVLEHQIPAYAGTGDPDDWVACFADPADVLVVVAGGGGVYSAAIPTWCAGTHRTRAVSAVAWVDQSCAVPGLAVPADPDPSPPSATRDGR